MIEVRGLTKHYGSRRAVDDLSFDLEAGRVTGFVGPNGAGKSTTMRMMVDLARPDRGEVRYDGLRYAELAQPARTVGAVLDARCMHPGRTARNHLRAIAALSAMSAGFLGARIGGLDVGDTAGLAATVVWALLYTVGAGLLGLGVGMVVRHSAGAVSGLLVWWLVVEGLVVSFAPAEVVRFVPFDAGARTLDIATELDRPEVVAAALPNLLHAAIFWSYVVGALVLGTVLLMRRDVD